MTTKRNTEKVSTDSGWKLIADVCHKADKSELLRRALKKLVNMKPKALLAFLGEVQIFSGPFKKVAPDIFLEATELLNTKDFFKIRREGGIFVYVDENLFNWFDNEIKNSPAKKLAGYEFNEDISEQNIIGDAQAGGIYEETDLAHISQICERHIVKGEKLLSETSSNLFWVRDENDNLCNVYVWLYYHDGCRVRVRRYIPSKGWVAGVRSFFRN